MKNTNLFFPRDSWINENFSAKDKKMPVSFTYAGLPFDFSSCSFGGNIKDGKIDISAKDAKSGLLIRCAGRIYDDYPAVEWTVWLKNESDSDTQVLHHINAIDSRFTAQNSQSFLLRTNRGDICTESSYEPIEKTLNFGDSKYFAPEGGRPTSGSLPYFNIAWDDGGVLMGMGWLGQWRAKFYSDKKNQLKITGGQEITQMFLRPGEEIRTPLVLLMFRGEDFIASQNMWRQFMLDHNMQKIRGKRIMPFNSVCAGIPVSEKIDLETIDSIVKNKIKIDYYWNDASWYISETTKCWTEVGTWRSDPERYPNTQRAVSDHAHKNNLKTVLWIEYERVSPGSEMSKYKDWLLSLPNDKKSFRSDRMYHEYFLYDGQFPAMESYRNQLLDGDCLFNFGNGEARKFMTELISNILTEYGIDCFRTDFNIAPIEFWLSADESDGDNRFGMTENKYITGILKFWDELQERFPDVVFDTCSSGGRRNDLETLRRATPLLRTDYQARNFCTEGSQGHTYGIASWLPFAGNGCGCDDVYLYRSHLSPFMGVGCSGDTEKWRKAADDWSAVRDYFYGDYYPLTDYNLSLEKWIAWQFHAKENQSGMIQAFRRANCPDDSLKIKLNGLIANAEYEIENLDESKIMHYSGEQLMNGDYSVILPDAPCSAIFKYKKI